MPALDPEVDRAVEAMQNADAQFVIIGGFAVIANQFVRATEDIDLLIPDDAENDRRVINALQSLNGVHVSNDSPLTEGMLLGQDNLRVKTDAGLIDLIRGGAPPLDFETVEAESIEASFGGPHFRVAGLRSVVGFKRLAGRPRDRLDLEALEEIHGELPIDPIPGLDS